jgi:uncharacterized protein YdeI (BOF family)
MLNKLRIRSIILAGAAGLALTATPTAAEEAVEASNGEWLSLSGSVVSRAPESFVLDYGDDTITVEMDDYDWYNENAVTVGDEVIVTGRMDADFWENRKIEADSVFVGSRNAMYFASAADEEGTLLPILTFDPLTAGESVSLTGTVSSIVGDEMHLDAGLLEYTVDAGELGYDPFDSDGAQRIAVGDRVSVYGRMDSADLFDRREIDALSITELG